MTAGQTARQCMHASCAAQIQQKATPGSACMQVCSAQIQRKATPGGNLSGIMSSIA